MKTFVKMLSIVLLLILITIGLSGSSAVKIYSDKVDPQIYAYNSNTRVLQWKHYYDQVVTQQAQVLTLRGREFYRASVIRLLLLKNIPKDRAEIYAEIPEIESAWRSNAKSPVGAQGLWQTMPGTAAHFGYKGQDLSDPAISTECSAKILAYLDSTYQGDIAKVLFAYNGGVGTVDSALKQHKTNDVWMVEFKSRETYNFAPKVLGAWLHNKEEKVNQN